MHEHDCTKVDMILTEAGLSWKRALCRLECKVNDAIKAGYRLHALEPVHDCGSLFPRLRVGYIAYLVKA